MKLWKCLLLASLLTLSLGLSITLPTIKAQAAQGRSLYPELRPALDERVRGIMEQQHIPGMAVVVIKDGFVLEMKGYGFADREDKRIVDPNTKFGIASLTKPFTAMAVMMLVEEGKVSLDTPISQYLTDLPAQWAPLTLRQLLSHTSGISEDYPSLRVDNPKDLLRLGKPELDFPPGEAWSYSNTGFRLAGLVIEAVSGQRYSDFMRDRIFTPLEMQQTQAELAQVPNLATGYRWDRRLHRVEPIRRDTSYASGNIISTAIDMAKWVRVLEQGKLLQPSSYQQLYTATVLRSGRSADYGLGWFVGSFNGHPFIRHGGNTAGYSSGLSRYPNDRLDVIVLTNNLNVDGTSISSYIASLYDPSISITSLSSQSDPNPEFTKRFLSLLQGDEKSIPSSPEFEFFLNTKRGKEFKEQAIPALRQIEELTFLHEEVKQDGDRTYYYRTFLKEQPVYALITVTDAGEIVIYGVFVGEPP